MVSEASINAEVSSNAPTPISVMLSGIVIDFKDSHL